MFEKYWKYLKEVLKKVLKNSRKVFREMYKKFEKVLISPYYMVLKKCSGNQKTIIILCTIWKILRNFIRNVSDSAKNFLENLEKISKKYRTNLRKILKLGKKF